MLDYINLEFGVAPEKQKTTFCSCNLGVQKFDLFSSSSANSKIISEGWKRPILITCDIMIFRGGSIVVLCHGWTKPLRGSFGTASSMALPFRFSILHNLPFWLILDDYRILFLKFFQDYGIFVTVFRMKRKSFILYPIAFFMPNPRLRPTAFYQ